MKNLTLCQAIKEYKMVKKLKDTNPKILYDKSDSSFIVTWFYSENLINKVYNNLFVKVLKL